MPTKAVYDNFGRLRSGRAEAGESKEGKKTFDDLLAASLTLHFSENDLTVGLISGLVVPKKEAVVVAVMSWAVSLSSSKRDRICIRPGGTQCWLLHEHPDTLSIITEKADNRYLKWLGMGALHGCSDQFCQKPATDEIPTDWMETRSGRGGLKVYSHLYNRLIPMPKTVNFHYVDDFRAASLARLFEALTWWNLGPAESKGKLSRVLEQVGAPLPFYEDNLKEGSWGSSEY